MTSEIADVRAPHVACVGKCADCCRMNVSISGLEAKLIAEATGRKAATVEDSIRHEQGRFVGVACPFLRDDLCTIYEHRPLVCRNHASFYPTAKWCMPEHSLHTDSAPQPFWLNLECAGQHPNVVLVLHAAVGPTQNHHRVELLGDNRLGRIGAQVR